MQFARRTQCVVQNPADALSDTGGSQGRISMDKTATGNMPRVTENIFQSSRFQSLSGTA